MATWSSASMPTMRVDDLDIDGLDRLEHALAEIAALVAVAQLDRLVRAGRGAGRHGGAAHRAVLQHDIDLDRRIAAAVEDLAADDVDDRGHGRLRSGRRRVSALLANGLPVGKPQSAFCRGPAKASPNSPAIRSRRSATRSAASDPPQGRWWLRLAAFPTSLTDCVIGRRKCSKYQPGRRRPPLAVVLLSVAVTLGWWSACLYLALVITESSAVPRGVASASTVHEPEA